MHFKRKIYATYETKKQTMHSKFFFFKRSFDWKLSSYDLPNFLGKKSFLLKYSKYLIGIHNRKDLFTSKLHSFDLKCVIWLMKIGDVSNMLEVFYQRRGWLEWKGKVMGEYNYTMTSINIWRQSSLIERLLDTSEITVKDEIIIKN